MPSAPIGAVNALPPDVDAAIVRLFPFAQNVVQTECSPGQLGAEHVHLKDTPEFRSDFQEELLKLFNQAQIVSMDESHPVFASVAMEAFWCTVERAERYAQATEEVRLSRAAWEVQANADTIQAATILAGLSWGESTLSLQNPINTGSVEDGIKQFMVYERYSLFRSAFMTPHSSLVMRDIFEQWIRPEASDLIELFKFFDIVQDEKMAIELLGVFFEYGAVPDQSCYDYVCAKLSLLTKDFEKMSVRFEETETEIEKSSSVDAIDSAKEILKVITTIQEGQQESYAFWYKILLALREREENFDDTWEFWRMNAISVRDAKKGQETQ